MPAKLCSPRCVNVDVKQLMIDLFIPSILSAAPVSLVDMWANIPLALIVDYDPCRAQRAGISEKVLGLT